MVSNLERRSTVRNSTIELCDMVEIFTSDNFVLTTQYMEFSRSSFINIPQRGILHYNEGTLTTAMEILSCLNNRRQLGIVLYFRSAVLGHRVDWKRFNNVSIISFEIYGDDIYRGSVPSVDMYIEIEYESEEYIVAAENEEYHIDLMWQKNGF